MCWAGFRGSRVNCNIRALPPTGLASLRHPLPTMLGRASGSQLCAGTSGAWRSSPCSRVRIPDPSWGCRAGSLPATRAATPPRSSMRRASRVVYQTSHQLRRVAVRSSARRRTGRWYGRLPGQRPACAEQPARFRRPVRAGLVGSRRGDDRDHRQPDVGPRHPAARHERVRGPNGEKASMVVRLTAAAGALGVGRVLDQQTPSGSPRPCCGSRGAAPRRATPRRSCAPAGTPGPPAAPWPPPGGSLSAVRGDARTCPGRDGVASTESAAVGLKCLQVGRSGPMPPVGELQRNAAPSADERIGVSPSVTLAGRTDRGLPRLTRVTSSVRPQSPDQLPDARTAAA